MVNEEVSEKGLPKVDTIGRIRRTVGLIQNSSKQGSKRVKSMCCSYNQTEEKQHIDLTPYFYIAPAQQAAFAWDF